MKHLIANSLLVCLLLALTACAPFKPSGTAQKPVSSTIPVPDGYKLAWSDEFEGPSIDPKNWIYDLGAGGWGNNEAEFYTASPENARIENGQLVVEARQEKYQGSDYTSARLKTQGLQEFQYGRIETRLKVPAGAGLWPAVWMLGADINEVNWPNCGEIDIMEYIGKEPDLIMGTLHGPGYSGASGITQWNRQKHKIADDYHTFAIEWQSEQITWFYDGVQYHKVNKSDIGSRKWVLDHPFFLVINMAVGGQLAGPVAEQTVFPAQLLVDYVRVYQKVP